MGHSILLKCTHFKSGLSVLSQLHGFKLGMAYADAHWAWSLT